MQRSPSEHRGAPPSNARSPARDPRIKNRTGSTPGLDRDTDTGRDRLLDNREALRRGDETPSTSTPQSTTSRLDNAITVLNEPPDLQKAFSRHARNALNADFFERKRNYLRQELEGVRAEHEKYKRTKDKYPIPADQAQKEKSRLENEYTGVKREELKWRAAEESSAATLTKLLREILTGKDEELKRKDEELKQKDGELKCKDDRYNVLAAQIVSIQGEMQDLRAQQAKPPAQTPSIPKELNIRIQKLEESHDKQKMDNAAFKAVEDGLKASRQSIQDHCADSIKQNQESKSEIDRLRQEQLSTSKDTIQTSKSLKLKLEGLHERIEFVEHRLPSIESQILVSETKRATEREQVQQIQEAAVAQRRTADDTERLRRSIHLKVETLSGEFKDGISNIKSDLRSLSSDFYGIRDNHQKLARKVDGLEAPVVAKGPLLTSLESEINSLKRVGQDQLEKLAALDTSVEEVDTKVSSLMPLFDQIPAAMEQLGVLHAQLAERSASWQGLEGKVNAEIKTVRQQTTDSLTTGQNFDDTPLSKQLKAMEDRMDEFASQHTMLQERLNNDIKSTSTALSKQAAAQSHSITKLEQEFTRYTEARTASEEQRDLALMDDITKLRRELSEDLVTVTAAYAQRPIHSLSPEERLQISNIPKFEARLDTFQKSLEKQSHMSLDLNHRYNNLTTESLARRMMGVANKALPIFEKGLQKLEADVQGLREEAAKPVNIIPAELEKNILSIQESVESLRATFQSKHDVLAKSFADGRDTIVKKIEELEESAARNETSQLTYRESTARNFKAFEIRLDNVNTTIDDIDNQMEEISTRELFPRKDRGNSSNGLHGPSKQPKIGNHSIIQKNQEATGANSTSSVSVSRVVQGSDDEDDNEANRRDLLEQFRTKPAPREATPRQSKRKGLPPSDQPSTKRRRSQSQENTNDFEFSIKGGSSKGTRR